MDCNLSLMPSSEQLIEPTYNAIVELGGSGTNEEIYDKVCSMLNLPKELEEYPHLGSTTTTELYYRIAWAKTKLKKIGRITNSSRGVWTIYVENSVEETDPEIIYEEMETEDDVGSWRNDLLNTMMSMDPYDFEKLAMMLLRESGFESMTTKKSRDGGVDGFAKLKVHGMFSFNVAFQCKRYQGKVPSSDIRDFRGSFPNSVEKGIFITTGIFSDEAKKEAMDPSKQQIDLIDGNELVTRMMELEMGLKKTYVVDKAFFRSLSSKR